MTFSREEKQVANSNPKIAHVENYFAGGTNISSHNIGAVQSGQGNVANINQNIGSNAVEILQALQNARESFTLLSQHECQEATELIEVVEAEITTESRTARAKACGRALLPFLEKVGATLAVEGLKKWLGL